MTTGTDLMPVHIARIGEEMRTVTVPYGATVQDVANVAGIELRGFEARIGMGVVAPTAQVNPNETVFIMPKITGGC